MRYKRLKIEGAAYFFTLVTQERRKLFADPDCVALLDMAITRVRQRHPFELEALVVLPDHLHALWQLLVVCQLGRPWRVRAQLGIGREAGAAGMGKGIRIAE